MWGGIKPRPTRPFPALIWRVGVYGYRRAPVATGIVVVVAAVEPQIDRIHGIGGHDTRSGGVARRAVLYSQGGEIRALCNTATASGGRRRGALINKWALLDG